MSDYGICPTCSNHTTQCECSKRIAGKTCKECAWESRNYCRRVPWRYDDIPHSEFGFYSLSMSVISERDLACPAFVPKPLIAKEKEQE